MDILYLSEVVSRVDDRNGKLNMENLVIYGAGERGRNLILLMDSCGWKICAVVDGNRNLWGTYIGSHQIKAPEVLRNMDEVTLCITPMFHADSIRSHMADALKGKVREISYSRLIQNIYATVDFSDLLKTAPVCNREEAVIFACLDGMALGGVQEWTKDICTKFLEEKNENTYILSTGNNGNIAAILKNHILDADLDAGSMNSVDNMRKLAACLQKHLPCILVTSYPYEVFAGKIVKEAYPDKIRIICGIRNAAENTYQEYLDFQEYVDVYVCVSSDITKEMIRRGIEENRVYTMICPVKCPDRLMRAYTTQRQQPVRLGYAGRIVALQKRMDLMEKMIEVLETQKTNYYFELAGEGGYLQRMQEFIIERHLQEKVKFVGVLSKQEIDSFWKDKDICINIADFEGRSRSIAEAMANGAVPIVTDTSGVKDDIRDGENGYIVAIGDYEAIADRVAKLEQNRNLLHDMGMKAHIELKGKCSMDKHYQFWKEVIHFEVDK